MKWSFVVAVAAVGAACGEVSAPAVVSPVDFPDPVVVNSSSLAGADTLSDDEHFLALSTNTTLGNVPMLASSTLPGPWHAVGDALPELPVWAEADAGLTWAPALVRRGDVNVLYFTARDLASDFQCIGRATSRTPLGPYVDDSADPIVCQVELCGSIDPSVFIDDDGQAFLLWKSDENAAACAGDSRLWSQPLDDSGALVGTPTVLLQLEEAWEAPLIEGPALLRDDVIDDDDGNDFILFYSANRWESDDYAIGIARCASPTGPCERRSVDAPWRSSTRGPGGPEVVRDDDNTPWLVFHQWSAEGALEGGGVRVLTIEPLDLATIP